MRFLEITPGKFLFLAILFIPFFVFSARSLYKTGKMWQKAFLMGLRCLSFLLFSMAFLRLSSLKKTFYESQGKIAIQIDTSGSTFLGEDGGAINLLKKKLHTFLDNLSSSETEVDLFTIDEKVNPTSYNTFLSIETSTKETKIIDSLEEFLGKRKGDYEGIILFSDGIDNSKSTPEFLAEEEIPINTVRMPPPSGKDVWIESVKFPPVGFKKVPFSIEITIKSKGISGDGRLKIYLNGEEQFDKKISIKRDEEIKVVKELTIHEEGSYLLYITLSPFSGEITYMNNSYVNYSKVIRDKNRVLQVVGTPNWDVRFLRRFLKKNLSIDLVTFMILRTRDDYIFVRDDELSLIPFPTREIFIEAIDTFDAVIFQNYNHLPYGPIEYLTNLKRIVETGKTGFILLGGDRAFYKGGYANTCIEDISPVKFINSPESYVEGEFKVKLTEEGKIHPITSFLEEFIEKLPPLHTINLDIQPKKDSVVLLKEEKGNPILVIGEREKGRSVLLATNSLWEWHFTSLIRYGFEVYTKLMQNMLNWVIGDPYFREISIEEGKESLKITVKDKNLKKCKRCRIKLKILSPDGIIMDEKNFVSEDGEMILKKGEIPSPSILLVEANGAQGIYPLKGEEKLEFKSFKEKEKLLERIASLSGGRFFEFDEFKPEKAKLMPKKKKIESSKEIKEIWNSSVFIFIFFGVIIMEWAMRRKWGMR